jgi:hypothetical protein
MPSGSDQVLLIGVDQKSPAQGRNNEFADTKSATQTIWVSDEGRFDLLSRHSGGRCKVADGSSPNNAR